MGHLHVNTADFEADHEIALPLRALDELVANGMVSASAREHVSVMGYQSAGLDEWRTKTGPEIAAMLKEQSVDGVVLAPNCPDCCKNVPVLARHLEREGIPTVLVTMMPDVAEKLATPRVVGVEFPFGHAFGPANDRHTQRRLAKPRSPYSAAHQNQAFGSTSTSNGPSKPEKHTKHGNQQNQARSSRRHWASKAPDCRSGAMPPSRRRPSSSSDTRGFPVIARPEPPCFSARRDLGPLGGSHTSGRRTPA